MKILIAIPAYNEEKIIVPNLRRLLDFCRSKLEGQWEIVVADNNSTDATAALIKEFFSSEDKIKYLFVPQPGKGAAIRAAWQSAVADVYLFMDADLSVELNSLPGLVEKIQQGAALAIGSRYLPQSKVLERGFLRGATSRGYHFLASNLLSLKVSDFPCGFKAINQRVKDEILPQIQNNQWFFDTELLVLTWQAGWRISEVPVIWKESSRASRVSLLKVIKNYLQEIFKLKARLKK